MHGQGEWQQEGGGWAARGGEVVRGLKVMGVPVLLSHPQESRQVTLEVTNERGRGALATFNCTR